MYWTIEQVIQLRSETRRWFGFLNNAVAPFLAACALAIFASGRSEAMIPVLAFTTFWAWRSGMFPESILTLRQQRRCRLSAIRYRRSMREVLRTSDVMVGAPVFLLAWSSVVGASVLVSGT